jgi:hypothetical protein
MKMTVKWEHESEHLLVARLRGKLAKTEIEDFQAAVAPILRASGNIKFLVILEDFEGWEVGKGWEDTSFTDANDQFLSRFALVGDEKWRDKALMFSLAGLRPVDIQYFTSENEAAARAWLAEDPA